jgi:protein-L-isoaspartate(D-aspartate) O-methyltransferase
MMYDPHQPGGNGLRPAAGSPRLNATTEFDAARHAMVETQLRRRGLSDTAVLTAMDRVPRHEFVPPEFRHRAYEDAPLPIGEGQTISQPYIVAAMTAALRLAGHEHVLEIGTGCGYQAAILACVAKEVFSIEYHAGLAASAAVRLDRLGYPAIHVHCGDGSRGLPDFAPFDAILVAAAAPSPPEPLVQQLGQTGRMIVPVGNVENQELQLIERIDDALRATVLEPCRFVPLVGAYGWKESSSQ